MDPESTFFHIVNEQCYLWVVDASPGSIRTFLTSNKGLALLVLAAVVLPRLVAFWGLSHTVDSPPGTDMVQHLYRLDLLAKSFALEDQLASDPYFQTYPLGHHQVFQAQWTTGVYAVARPLAQLFGPQSIWTVQLTNLLFTLVLLAGVVGLGAAMGSTRLGLWAALVTALCPALFATSWYFVLDGPLTAMVAVGLFLLWRTGGFAHSANTVAFGLWSGLGLWIKLSYPFYLLVPSCWALALRLWRGPRLRPAINVLLAVVLCLGIFTLVEAPDFGELIDDIRFHADAEKFLDKDMAVDLRPWTWAWLSSQVVFAGVNFPFPLLLLLLPALALLHRRCGLPRELTGRGMVLVTFWGGLVVLTLLMVKMERYLQPLYPVICLITAWGAHQGLPRRWRRAGVAVVLAAYAGVLILAQSVPTPWFTMADPHNPRGAKYLDMRMQGWQRLARLRERTVSTNCRVQPALETLASWVPASGPGGLLAVVYLQEWESAERPAALVYHELRLPLLQQYRQRFVAAFVHGVAEPLPGAVLNAPALVLVHAPQVRPASLVKNIRVVKRKDLTLQCNQGSGKVSLSLVRRR